MLPRVQFEHVKIQIVKEENSIFKTMRLVVCLAYLQKLQGPFSFFNIKTLLLIGI